MLNSSDALKPLTISHRDNMTNDVARKRITADFRLQYSLFNTEEKKNYVV